MSSVKHVSAAPAPPDADASGRLPAQSAQSAVDLARQARKVRLRKLLRALYLWVGIPTLLSVVYLFSIAKSQYESFATLMVTGSSPGLLREYAQSRDMLAQLEGKVGFSRHYQESGDFFAGLSADAQSESRYRAFRSNVELRVGAGGVVRVRVRAFSARAARRFAATLIDEARAFLAIHAPGHAEIVFISKPSTPTEATRPRRWYGVLTTFLVSSALFAIGALLIAAAREHAQF